MSFVCIWNLGIIFGLAISTEYLVGVDSGSTVYFVHFLFV